MLLFFSCQELVNNDQQRALTSRTPPRESSKSPTRAVSWVNRLFCSETDCTRLFSCSIPPWFVLSCNLPTTNARAIWLCFSAFLSPPAPCLRLHGALTTGHYSHAPRPTPHAPRPTPHAPRASICRYQRGQVVRRPFPAGYCPTPTAELARLNGARTRRALPFFQYGTKPGDPYGKIHPFFLARRRWTVDHSFAAGGAQRQWLPGTLKRRSVDPPR